MKLPNLFESLTKLTWFLNSVEDVIVNLVSIIVPWGVPLIPAYITWYHVQDPGGLNWDVWIAWVAGGVVEGLGLATMNTYFKFRRHNAKYTDPKNRFSVWIPILSYVWYLGITLLVNVVFDIASGVDWWFVLAIALFTTLSIPAAALISTRAQYIEWYVERNASKPGLPPPPQPKDEQESEANASFAQMIHDYMGSRGLEAKQIGLFPGAFMSQKDFVSQLEEYIGKSLDKNQKKNLGVILSRMRAEGK